MSMARAKENLERLLADSEIRVLALSGKWGTGKSHMWKGLHGAAPTDSEIKKALYVSLFGVATIPELKLKLAQSAAPLLNKKGAGMDTMISTYKAAKQIGQSFIKGLSVLDEIASLAVPALLRNKFIVVDDIERKHEKLTIDEILGFIDDFTQNYGCRILLILNSDQLADKAIWEKFREKVIDEELRLDTTPSEAFDIAIRLLPSQFSEKIKPAVETCGLTNIRIIRKVIRAVNRILDDHAPLPDDVLNRIIPSTVLLSAIHYKGIDGGPTMAYVLDFEASFHARIALRERERRGEEATEEDKLHARWGLLFERLGIMGTDEYEKLLSDYLNSGLLDRSALDAIVDRYRREHRLAGAQSRARTFFQSTMWDPELTDEKVLEAGRTLLADVPYLDCYAVTSLHDYLLEFEGGQSIADQIVTSWIDRLRAKAAEPGAEPGQFILDNWTGRPLHPAIVAAFEAARNLVEKPKTLLDVSLYLAQSNGWNPSEEAVMQSATVEDFQGTILGLRGEQLKMFMLKNMDIYANRQTYEKHFGSAPAHFLEACRRICADRAGTRWEELIKNVFNSSKLAADLDEAKPAEVK